MNRGAVEISSQEGLADSVVLVSPTLIAGLGLSEDRPVRIRFGTRSTLAEFLAVHDQPPEHMILSPQLARALALEQPLRTTVGMDEQGEVALGPLVGLLISKRKLESLLAGAVDTVYCRYTRYALEVNAVLCFFTSAGLDLIQGTVQGYMLRDGRSDWEFRRFPIPRVIYDRCFGEAGRGESAQVRGLLAGWDSTVVNGPVKITKLAAFEALRGDPEVEQYLPYTVPFSPKALKAVLDTYPDVYVKPNALYKGKGVLRLTRQGSGWLVQVQGPEIGSHFLPDKKSVERTLLPLAERHDYVIQEGLALATYLGNRFDFRSLVQKNGNEEWTVSGLAARLAPVGGTITSPRSGGSVARAQEVLQHAFPERWESVLEALEHASLIMSRKIDARLGPCIELGLDVGVLRDGSVKLIEANGKPLRVSLQRLRDPLITERIHRYPIHCAAAMDLAGWREVPS